MPAKAFVIFFRYKLLLLAPFLVTIPLAIAYVFMSGTTVYQAVGKVDVIQPSFLSSAATSRWNPYISGAANQSNFVNQKLKTREFTERVAARASDGFSRSITAAEVSGGGWASPLGDNLLAVGTNSGDPEVGRRIAQAIIDEYAIVERENILAEAEVAIEAKEAALAQRRTTLEEALAERDAYLDSRPDLARDQQLADRDVRLLQLNKAVGEASDAVRSAEADLAETNAYVQATLKGAASTFRPIEADAPETPAAPLGRKMMELVGPPVLAFLAALSLSAIIYGFLFRTDRSLRSRDDIVAVLPNVTYLGSVPDVGTPKKRAWPRDFVRVTASSGDDVEDALRRA